MGFEVLEIPLWDFKCCRIGVILAFFDISTVSAKQC